MGEYPTGDPHCPDCGGKGTYQGLGAVEPCRTCSPKEGDSSSVEDALGFLELVDELFPEGIDEDTIAGNTGTPSDPLFVLGLDDEVYPKFRSAVHPGDTRDIAEICREQLRGGRSEFKVVRTPTVCGFGGMVPLTPKLREDLEHIFEQVKQIDVYGHRLGMKITDLYEPTP